MKRDKTSSRFTRNVLPFVNYGFLFSRSLRLVWQHKWLWVFGLFMGLGSYTTDFFAGRLLEQLPEWPISLSAWQSFLTQLDPVKMSSIGGGVVVGVVAATFVFWLLATWGEASLICAVYQETQGMAVPFQQAARQGIGLLGRFIAIDALVFFPWFLLALLAMVVILVLLLGIGFLSYQNAALEWVMGVTGLGGLCLVPLLCLLVPVGYLTFIFRTVAFRDSAVYDTGARATVRHTWGVVRRRWGEVLIMALMVVTLQLSIGLLLNLVVWPITAVSAYFSLTLLPSHLDMLLILPQTILQTCIATFWTVAFLEIMRHEV